MTKEEKIYLIYLLKKDELTDKFISYLNKNI